MRVLNILSISVLLLTILRFVALLDAISFDFGYVSYIVRIVKYLPTWILIFMGIIINNIISYRISNDNRNWNILCHISTGFYILVLLVELLMTYICSKI